jgi:surfactin synthase thioesterase subunit
VAQLRGIDRPASDIIRGLQPQRGLSDAAFKLECQGWDVSDALLKDDKIWAQYVALMRADFRLFDEYNFGHASAPPFDFPITAFVAEADRKVSRGLVEGWARFTSAGFALHSIKGNHLFVLATGTQRDAKDAWLQRVVAEMRQLI